MRSLVITNKESCIKNEEFCIKNDELCSFQCLCRVFTRRSCLKSLERPSANACWMNLASRPTMRLRLVGKGGNVGLGCLIPAPQSPTLLWENP